MIETYYHNTNATIIINTNNIISSTWQHKAITFTITINIININININITHPRTQCLRSTWPAVGN